MPVNDELGKRMKEYYEYIPKLRLMRRTPVIVRIDGKAFHTFTRGFNKPFDEVLMKSMQSTMQYLCENVQGCVLGYTQSDEISLLLIDYLRLNSGAFFDYEVQKICSITSSMATAEFNEVFVDNAFNRENADIYARHGHALFDSRCFNIPKEEVTNYFYWRQLDATRNSIQMVGQVNFSHKELQNRTCSDIQDMLMLRKGVNWNNFPTKQKHGSCCIKTDQGWTIDNDIPIFKGDGREYIEKLVMVGE